MAMALDWLKEHGDFGAGVMAVFRKEFADHLNSKRFIILALLVAVTGISSIYVAAKGISGALGEGGPDFVFLGLFTSSGSSLPPFVSFVSFLGPLVGLAIGFDAINGEMVRGTLSRLLAQPIHRDAVINGKFLAGLAVLSLMIVTLGLVVGGLGLTMIGIPPGMEEVARILVYLVITIVYVAFWLSLSLLFSLLFKQAATSALAGIALWLFLSIFLGLISGLVADSVAPVNDQSSAEAVMRNQAWQQNLSRVSPTVLYDEAILTILSPGVRTLSSVVLQQQMEGAVAGSLPLGQSLLLVWPHLVGLIAAMLICFAAAYVLFMRREVRA